jgi:hypothetical protein
VGEASRRGNFAARQRKAQLVQQSEVTICINATKEGLKADLTFRDSKADEQSHAVIMGNWIGHNWNALAEQAMTAYKAYRDAQEPAIVTDVPHRPIVTADGERAVDAPLLVGVDGEVLQ